ncbi:D-3-phosphoglycerate dehydrogenase [Puccinia graminis f. sp. tritici CRL 75-36-700-3]|uniref:D-3-phosphoglycerate dehydrogenase n=1 Tax=Puccinia graminis f. sp. tritici (strain CRL 75-36-700-3 / race SCCL) TaxID=418459 RepID=E3K0F6_PUCGT|nr:D-3-phosphoglycerate dehydrogenase [Puccinia graminis f. sp. tritici CRL 75-36-700-3]EFP77781.1 D-3-phosphoglycerate dehydrogenase [Puccinia graminis f. sp. tritici CRL 75-36-700-3]
MGAETNKADEPLHGGREGEMTGRDGAEDRVRSLAPKAQHSRALSVPKVLTPWAVKETRILLLENINPIAVKLFKDHGYTVDEIKHALNEDQLIEHLRSNHYSGLGIRSKTRVTERVIKEAGANLLVIGCFCIGTNQVDLDVAASAGICVFNSPFSNSRSVAELVIGELIALARQLTDRSSEIHNGVWNKVSKGCYEVRGKTLGIVGYGHIGSQLSVLAEAMGMNVIYYDVLPIMPLGSATQIDTLEAMLSKADFVSLHVPELPETINLVSAKELGHMKPGSYLINNSRGRVVDIPALIEAMEAGRIAGAALDVFPNEPGSNGERFDDQLNPWTSRLLGLSNLILTSHIGGSTEEAQKAIGNEVSNSMIKYLTFGSTLTSVNFPEVSLRPILESGLVRVCHAHHNQPGVLKNINSILADYNVEKQYSDSKADIAYLMADIQLSDTDNRSKSHIEISDLFSGISSTSSNIKTRVLY